VVKALGGDAARAFEAMLAAYDGNGDSGGNSGDRP
jgi:hypothetical protein